MELVKIDGSYGEGGGSILRYALSLSAITLKPVEIFNIRAKRDRPGLRPQHLNAVRALAKLVDARVEGGYIGSKRIVFIPQHGRSGRFEIDIGTAGSISLIVQALLPASISADREVIFLIRGGTDVPMAPPIDYMKEVFLRNIALMGAKVEMSIHKRGHYPRGGGIVEVRIFPSSLDSIVKVRRDNVQRIRGRTHAVKLPRHVTSRIAKSAAKILIERGLSVDIEEEWSENSHLGPGAGIVLWTDSSPVIGSDDLGKRRKPSEEVGRNAALRLLEELDTGMALDKHSGDMIVPYLAMSSGKSRVGISKLTLHAESNIWLVKQFLSVRFRVEGGLDKPSIVEVEGAGV